MWNEKKPFLYDLRMYLFGQKYTSKEMAINWMTLFFTGSGTGIAIPVIIQNILGLAMDTKIEDFTNILLPFFFFALYIIIFYPIFYYISKGIVELFLFLWKVIRFK